MTSTHHAVRLFRLSCGCLRAYPMMPAGAVHAVLCAGCRTAAVTVLAYPDGRCGARGQVLVDGRALPVSCTRARGTCPGGAHHDACADAEFTVTARYLARSREGKTGRA